MTGPGFVQFPPDIDFAEPGEGALCPCCGSLEFEDGSCAVCVPRCLLEDTPLRCNGFTIDGAGNVRPLEATHAA